MARRVGLNAYTVSFKRVFSRGNSEVFSRTGAFNAFGLVRTYLEQRKDRLQRLGAIAADGQNADAEARVVLVTDVVAHVGSCVLEGIVEAGEGGYTSKIVDLNTEEVAHQKQTHEAEMPPFYFRFFFPDGQTKGLLILQRLGLYGAKGPFVADMARHFRGLEYTCQVDAVLDRLVLEKYLNGGEVRQVVLRAWKHGADNREMLRRSRIGGDNLDEGTEVQVLIRPRSTIQGLTERVRRMVRSDGNLGSIISIPGLPNPDEATVDVQHPTHGSKRFNIVNPDEAGVSEDVTSEVTLRGGHPTFASISRAARRLSDELAVKLY